MKKELLPVFMRILTSINGYGLIILSEPMWRCLKEEKLLK